MRKAWWGASLLWVSVVGCGPSPVEDRRQELLRSWGEDFLLPHYASLRKGIGELDSASSDLERERDDATLSRAQRAWWDARRPWKETEVFLFGPAVEEPERYAPEIDFWPARPDTVFGVLEGSEPIVANQLGAAAKGFPAIELLLFEDGALDAFQNDARRASYLGVLTKDLDRQVQALSNAWSPRHGNFLGELVDAGSKSETFDSLVIALSEMVHRLAFTVEAIRADKLEGGLAPDGTPRPDRLESNVSGRSIEDILDALRGIETLYFGDAETEVVGLQSYLRHRGTPFEGRMEALLASARKALRRIDLPLSSALTEDRKGVEAASAKLGELQRFIQVDVVSALALTTRFSENDGD